MTSFYQEALGGQPPCSRCGERAALDVPLSEAGQRGWCWTCTRANFQAETADFPGNRQVVLADGQVIDRRVQKAVLERHRADIGRWLKPEAASLDWRVFGSQEWFKDARPARVLVLLAILGSGLPSTLLRCPWLYQSSPAIADHPHAAVRWLVWEPDLPGYLEGTFDPVEGCDWSARRLAPVAVRDRDRLLSLVIPDAYNVRARLECLDAVAALRAEGRHVNRITLGEWLTCTTGGVDKKIQRGGLKNLRGLLKMADAVQNVQSRD